MSHTLNERANQIFQNDLSASRCRIDRLMVVLLLLQWGAGIVVALTISPLTWVGSESALHVHVPAAVILGGLLALAPTVLTLQSPGSVLNRHVGAASQVLFSSLFIHLSGGRIETHFHVFGSLAILALYRDWKVFVTATSLVSLDHLVRGIFWPESVFGVLASTPWRTVEHVCWVGFADAFLIFGCVQGIREMRMVAHRQAELEQAHEDRRSAMLQLESQTRALDQCAIVAETDAQGRMTYVNDNFCTISGFSRDELLGQDHRIVNSGHHPRSFFKDMYSTLHRGELWRGEVQNRRKDGSIYWVDTAIVPFMNDSGKVERLLAIRTDITDRKTAAEELKRVAERLDLATSAGHIGVWDYDIAQNRLVWDDQMHRLYGTTPHSFDGTYDAWEACLHPDDVETARVEVQAALRGEKPFDTEFRVITPDGDIRHLKASGIVERDWAKCAVRMIGVNSDVTALRRAKERAEDASRAKSGFLASMSHELRTPLNGVLGMAELLSKTALDDRQKQFVKACQQSGEALLQLINDVLDLSKIEAGKLELDIHPFELKPLVTETFDMMAWHATEKGLRASCEIDPAAHLVVNGDSCRFRQILINLITNAVKFTHEGEIAVHVAACHQQDNQTTIRVSVVDSGIGIPPEKRNRLFQTFSQVDSSTTRKFGGTGLGLSICKSLVDLMGGEIGVESEAGAGAEFWFEVPLQIIDQRISTNELHMKMLRGRRVLIVDQRETERDRLAGFVREWQMECVVAASIDEALGAIDEGDALGTSFDLALADSHLARGSDLDLFQWLSAREDLPVILSDTTGLESEDEIAALGVDATVRKAVKRSELYQTICHVLFGDLPEGTEESGRTDTESDLRHVPAAHILLAEDNRINSLYMSELLTDLGCTCDIVENGLRAVQAVREQTYDLVLMDCQMPEMDGFDATRAIRQIEADGTLQGHLPVIALTANAIKGDRERCLSAGMDEYLSKPVAGDDIAATISRFVIPRNETRTTEVLHLAAETQATEVQCEVDPVAIARDFSGPVIDADALLDRCMGRSALADSLLDELETTGLEKVSDLTKFAEDRDATGIKESAHALKGAAGILCAGSLHELAADIELASVESRFEDISTMVDQLSAEMQRCLEGLPALRDQVHLAGSR